MQPAGQGGAPQGEGGRAQGEGGRGPPQGSGGVSARAAGTGRGSEPRRNGAFTPLQPAPCGFCRARGWCCTGGRTRGASVGAARVGGGARCRAPQSTRRPAKHRRAPQSTQSPTKHRRAREAPRSTAEHRRAPQSTAEHPKPREAPQSTAEHRRTPQSRAKHRRAPQSTAKHRKAPQSTAKHRKAPQSTAKHRRAPRSTAEHRKAPQSTAEHRKAARSTAEHRKAPQSPAEHHKALGDGGGRWGASDLSLGWVGISCPDHRERARFACALLYYIHVPSGFSKQTSLGPPAGRPGPRPRVPHKSAARPHVCSDFSPVRPEFSRNCY